MERRVLADIDWWKVTEGQCDPNVDDADDSPFDGSREPIGDVPAIIDTGVESSLMLPWVTDTIENISEVHPSGLTSFCALPLTPLT